MMRQGATRLEVIKTLSLPSSTYHRLKNDFLSNGSAAKKPFSPLRGRQPVISDRTGRRILHFINKNKDANCRMIKAALNLTCSTMAIRTFFKRKSFEFYRIVRWPLLSARTKEKRLESCRKYENWNVEDWNKVHFTDESKVEFNEPNYRWMQKTERDHSDNVLGTTKWNTSVMI